MSSSLLSFAAAMALLLSAAPSATLAQENGDLIPMENCTIECENDATCRYGFNSYANEPTNPDGSPFFFHVENSRDGEYCDCTEDFTGVRCGRPRAKCGDTDHYCYHGGRCITSANSTSILEEEYFCDCNDAEYAGIPYVGKFCEHEGGVKCGDNTNNPDHLFFCVNGGQCKDNFWRKPHPCECEEGFRGPHCEFRDGHVPACDLECDNGGQCFIGLKTYEQTLLNDYWLRHDGKFQYCSCPDGYFGPKCEIHGVECGSSYCFNGGACVETLNGDGSKEFNCDCTGAHTETASFGGKYCQSESTAFCQKQNSIENGHLYCTNGGECDPENPHEDCKCEDGYHGPICEYHSKEVKEECDLECKNGGKCRHGVKDVGSLLTFGKDLEDYTNATSANWQHCVCPDGFFGVECEHEIEVCEGSDHVCLHGAKCVPKDETSEEGKSHGCDCEAGFDAFERHAGKYCQYSSTDICTLDRRQGTGRSAFNFCVNNGKCKDVVDHDESHPGCDCPPGFEGAHCEFLAGTHPQESSSSNSNNNSNSRNGILIALIILCILFAGLVIGFVLLRRRQAATGKDPIASANDVNISPRAESSGPTPFEGEETVVIGNEDFGKMETVAIC